MKTFRCLQHLQNKIQIGHSSFHICFLPLPTFPHGFSLSSPPPPPFSTIFFLAPLLSSVDSHHLPAHCVLFPMLQVTQSVQGPLQVSGQQSRTLNPLPSQLLSPSSAGSWPFTLGLLLNAFCPPFPVCGFYFPPSLDYSFICKCFVSVTGLLAT